MKTIQVLELILALAGVLVWILAIMLHLVSIQVAGLTVLVFILLSLTLPHFVSN